MDFFKDDAPKHFWNYLLIRSGSGQHPGLSKYFILGIRSWITMYIYTALFPAAGLPEMEKSVNPHLSFLSVRRSCGISLRGNIWHTLSPFMKAAPLTFHPPVKTCVILTTGRNLKISFMKWTGAPTSRKPSTAFRLSENTLLWFSEQSDEI